MDFHHTIRCCIYRGRQEALNVALNAVLYHIQERRDIYLVLQYRTSVQPNAIVIHYATFSSISQGISRIRC